MACLTVETIAEAEMTALEVPGIRSAIPGTLASSLQVCRRGERSAPNEFEVIENPGPLATLMT